MQGIHTLHLLGIPRMIGAVVSVICLIFVFDLAAVGGGVMAAWIVEGISGWNFLYNLTAGLHRTDFVLTLVKGLCFGLIIPSICLFNGYMAHKTITAVPPRVSTALLDGFLYCFVCDIILSVLFFTLRLNPNL